MSNKHSDKKRNPGSGKDKDDGSRGPMNWRTTGRPLLLWAAVIAAVIFLYSIYSDLATDSVEITYTELIQQIDNDNLMEISFTDREVEGVLKEGRVFASAGSTRSFSKITSRIPFPDYNYALIKRLEEQDIKIVAKVQSDFFPYLMTFLPWILIIFLWMFWMRQMQGGGGSKGLFSFGKSKAKLLTDERPKVNFNDVAGADEAKEELQEIIEFLKEPGKFQKLGGKIPKGALLLGPPGTGKTLLARAVAGEAEVPFFSMSGSDFVEMFVGVGASRVRDLFEQGKKNAPCIIFIDEIDAVGRHRGAGLGGGHDEREQTLNQLLVEMDGFESNEGVILVAATNRPDVLDPALLRPGRFDRQIVVPIPDVKGREGILKVHVRKLKLDEDIDLKVLARGTPGMSGADLANMANEAALLAARRDKSAVTMEEFEAAKDKCLMGTERRSLVIAEEEKIVTAFHEAGHTLVAKFLPKADPIHKVTIIPRGMAMGVTQSLPVDERHNYSREYLETQLAVLMGGREAEMLVFNELTTGAGNDLERSTKLARKMVCNWGMSDELGPVTFGKTDEHIFLGREIHQAKDYSEATAVTIDREIRKMIEKAQETASGILKKHTDKLHALANALLEKEIIDSREVDEIIGRASGDTEPVEEPAPTPEG